MRHALAIVLLSGTAFTPAFAADLAANSHVDAVTVFPSGAEVTRLAGADLAAGETTLVFAGLPGDLDPATLRVEGTADGSVAIGSVDSKLAPVMSNDTDAARRALEDRITALQDERRQLDQAIADASYQKSLMQQLAGNALLPSKDQARSYSAGDLGSVLDLVAGRLQALSKTVMDASLRQRDIDKAVDDLNKELAALAPGDEQRMTVSVHLDARAAGHGSFRLAYRIADAGWTPIYDARLTSPAKDKGAAIELVRRAEVAQATTESWDGVALTLSTARPIGATAAPDLEPVQIGGMVPVAGGALRSGVFAKAAPELQEAPASLAMDATAAPVPSKDEKVQQLQAEVQVAGFQALYRIPGRVSIDNSGTAKKVRIDTTTLAAELSARVVPKLDPTAYLTASFKLGGDTPLLPGAAMLYRDGVFVGQGTVPLLSPGEDARLGFGADDLIKVKRAEMKNLAGEEGILTTSKVATRAWDISVKNLHDVALPVTVIDQQPYSTQEDITVATLSGMTAPAVTDLDGKRGVLAWTVTPDPGTETVIHHGYKITMPKDKAVRVD